MPHQGTGGPSETVKFAEIYRDYFDFVWSSTRRLGVGLESLDDVVQEIFIVIHARLHTLERSEWERIEPLLPKPKVRQDGRGRPWRDSREVMAGVLWVLRTGAPWADLPHRYPPYQTCHRRFQQWVRSGALKKVLRALGHQFSEPSPLHRLDRPGFRQLLKGRS